MYTVVRPQMSFTLRTYIYNILEIKRLFVIFFTGNRARPVGLSPVRAEQEPTLCLRGSAQRGGQTKVCGMPNTG